MGSTRTMHTATLLSDGKVLVIGGDSTLGGPIDSLSTAELFDPATETFTPTGSMESARSGHTATLLQDGKVLVLGGTVYVSISIGKSLQSLGTAEIFDPISGTFSQTGSLGTARTAHTATLLNNGKVLVTGGLDYSEQSGGPQETPFRVRSCLTRPTDLSRHPQV